MTSEWKYDDKSREPAKKYDYDYQKLNKIATATHTTTCKQQYKMRSQIRDQVRIRAPRENCLLSQSNMPIKDVWAIEEAFGRANRPSTPMKKVMCNGYGEEASDVQEMKNMQSDAWF